MAAPIHDVIEHLVSGIVDTPDDVEVRVKQTRGGDLFEVRVNPDDLGKVIGRAMREPSNGFRLSTRSVQPQFACDPWPRLFHSPDHPHLIGVRGDIR